MKAACHILKEKEVSDNVADKLKLNYYFQLCENRWKKHGLDLLFNSDVEEVLDFNQDTDVSDLDHHSLQDESRAATDPEGMISEPEPPVTRARKANNFC